MNHSENEQRLPPSILQLSFKHVHHAPFFQNLHMSKTFSSWTNFPKPHNLYKMHITLNHLFCLSHFEWAAYTHVPRHKARLVFHHLRNCHQIDFINALDDSFRTMIYDAVCWNWSRNADSHLSTFNFQSSVTKETIIEDKLVNLNLFHHSCVGSWDKTCFASRPGI